MGWRPDTCASSARVGTFPHAIGGRAWRVAEQFFPEDAGLVYVDCDEYPCIAFSIQAGTISRNELQQRAAEVGFPNAIVVPDTSFATLNDGTPIHRVSIGLLQDPWDEANLWYLYHRRVAIEAAHTADERAAMQALIEANP